MKSATHTLRSIRLRLSAEIRETTIRLAPLATRFLIDSVGLMALPGYRAVARSVLRRWVRNVEAHINGNYYLNQVEQTARRHAALDPALHYCLTGWMQGFSPKSGFDPGRYRQVTTGLHWAADPFQHFAEHLLLRDMFGRSVTSIRAAPSIGGGKPAHGERPSERCVIYTAVVGGYDVVRAPEFIPQDCDFVVFSDHLFQAKGWTVVPLSYAHPDPRRAARHAKLHPHLYFPDHQYSLWLDANIGVRGDVTAFLGSLGAPSPVGAFIHPSRDCLFDEGEDCMKRFENEAASIAGQLSRYRAAAHPRAAGLWETSVLARRHHDPVCIGLMSEWWREIETGGTSDQVSFPFVANRRAVPVAALAPAGLYARNHPLLTSSPHLKIPLQPDPSAPPLAAVRRDVEVEAIAATVGIVVGDDHDDVRLCLDSLLPALARSMRMMIVDDGSKPETARYLANFAAGQDRTTLVRHDRSRGYISSVNAVLDAADGDWIILVDGDVVVPAGGLRNLVAAGEQLPRLGMIGALSNTARWQSVPEVEAAGGAAAFNRMPDGITVEDMAALCQAASERQLLVVPLLAGPCLAIRRSLLSAVGTLDEENTSDDDSAAIDLCLRAADHGFASAIATQSYVYRTRPNRGFAAGDGSLRLKHGAARVDAAMEAMWAHPGLASIRRRIALLLERKNRERS